MTHPASPPETPERLAARINVALLRLERLERQRHTLQSDIDAFLKEYFGAIAAKLHPHLLVRESEPEGVAQAGAQPPPAAADATEDATESAQALSALDALMHRLYRSLARQCHPDVNPDAPPQTMSALNAAYQNRELGSMMLISRRVAMTSEMRYDAHALRQHLEHITELAEAVERSLSALQESDANRLRRQMLLARLSGEDRLSPVIEGMQQRLIAG